LNKYTTLSKEDLRGLGGRGDLKNKELHNLYASPNIVRIMKSRIPRWAGHTAHIGEDCL
jgi:hypothetical protein